MWTRRQMLSRTGLGLFGMAGTCLGFAGDNGLPAGIEDDPLTRVPDGSASRGMITPKTDQAIQRGLADLNRRRASGGSWGTGQYTGNVAVTSLAAMAYMCAGHQPNRGVYGRLVLDALRFVLSRENVSGRNPGFLHHPQ